MTAAMKLYGEAELAALAKELRIASGKRQREVAEELGVSRPSVVFAENNPERNLGALRRRMIERLGGVRVEGPFYRVTKAKP